MDSRIINQDIGVRRTDYNNGFTLYTKVTPRKRKNAIYLAAKAGPVFEDGYPVGTSHLTEHASVTPHNMQVIERLHGSLNAQVSRHIVKINTENVKPRYIPIAAKLFYRLIVDTDKSYREFLIQTAKHGGDLDALGNETDMTEDRADDLLYDKMISAIFDGTPLARPETTTESDYIAIESDVVLRYMKTFLVPNNMTMAVVGSIDEEYIQLQVGQTFGRLEPKPLQSSDIVIPLETPHHTIREERDTKRINFGLGWRTPINSGDVAPIMVADYVLDNCAFYSLRCEQGISYRPKCVFSEHGVSSSLHFELGVKPKRFQEAVDQTSQVIRATRNDISPRDLIRARDKLMLELEDVLDDPDELADRIVTGHFYQSEYYDPVEMISKVNAVTRKQVLEAFEKYITPDRYTMVVLGPISKILVSSSQQ